MKLANDKRRLVLENAAMRERWGDGPQLCRDAAGTKLWWEHTINVEGNRLPIRIEYPSSYPSAPPDIVIATALPKKPGQHMLSGNRMCWIYPNETRRNKNKWNPSRDTAAMCVSASIQWFLAYLVWQTTGDWPVPDATD